MKRALLDTNVIIRYLVGDNSLQQKQAEQWFHEAQRGTIDIIVDPIVVAEAAFVLESYYRFSRDRIADCMEVFLSQRWMNVRERDALIDLWQTYRAGLHFVDSYLLSLARNTEMRVLSFDKKVQNRARSS